MKILIPLNLAFLLLLGFTSCEQKQAPKPNIVIIYADDMGYGDLNCQNPDSKIPTPNLDKLASEGMRFTDAHSSSGICSPSRFALLTGQYHWRRTHNIVESFGPPMFKEQDITLPEILRETGYATACIGKWHLGWNWNFINEEPSGEREYWGKTHKMYELKDLDWSKPLTGGPLDQGFDYYFGDGTINFPPYAFIENDKFVEAPNAIFEFNQFEREVKEADWDSRPGPKVKNWDPYKVLPTLTQKTKEWIGKQKGDRPFFLYLALPAPHAPIIPNDEFDGKSKAGAYGDFMVQTDWVAGEILKALKENGFEENTLVIFSSDNGPERFAFERAEKYGHFSMGEFRGLKRDVWEGGHHIPFVVKWPGNIQAGSISKEVISQVDIMATIAAITKIKIPKNAAPDSYDLSAVLKGKTYSSPIREATVQNTYKGMYGLRQGKWLYINKPTGEISKMPASFKKLRNYSDFKTKGLLFDLENDAEQRVNLYTENQGKVMVLDSLLQKYRQQGYSVKRDQ
ncbi:arylsulfatase [Labilibaculum filiforme]|uniref:Arylsulfatase n=1 Tax=Labilibaculum filiforme TaxID=1940526 RepID=A0A2N3HWW0_9BACT|nr:arylsulfatase [Labilibaculum filiforme]PKQ62513.1 arylsulfatase [Labilibaculum filiforme]